MATVLATKLVRTPGICGGKLRIDGTRMTVGHIVRIHQEGLTPEVIVGEHPQRTLGEIYTVLAWYYDNQEEFDAEMAAEDAADQAAYEAHLASTLPKE